MINKDNLKFRLVNPRYNEETGIREAVKKDGYDTYFVDRFAGDFGHCTVKGNKLLADNIAAAILRDNLIK